MSMKVIRSKAKGSGGANDQIYSQSMYRREICAGTVEHNGQSHHVSAPTNSIPLDCRVQKSSLRTTLKWDWKNGGYTRESASLLDNSRRSINSLKVRSVTSGWNEKHDDEANLAVGMASPVVQVKKDSVKTKKGKKDKKG